MENNLQTILGSGGVIGTELAKSLKNYTDHIRLVSRHPKAVNDTDTLFPADLSDKEHIFKAIEGSAIVYITIGFDYNIKVWREKWPPLMRSVIEACKLYKAKLVFFDNVYLYDATAIPHMTEDSPINPPSRKGKVRAEIAKMVMDGINSGELTALIARAADFYGPKNDKSVLIETVYSNLKKDKTANWFANATKKHSFIYTPDAARATALLGNTPDAYNQVWHLPTDSNLLTGKEWVELFAREMGKKNKVSVLPKWLAGVLGIFIPIMGEFAEMFYQYNQDYFFDSKKFDQRFEFRKTSYQEGVKNIVESDK